MSAKSDPVAQDVRHTLNQVCDEMLHRLHALLKPEHKVAKEVHALRKLGKSVRGGMVLLEVEPENIRAVTAVGRLLGGARDAVSRRTTWERLGLEDGPMAGDPTVIAVGALLRNHAKSATHRPPEEVVSWAEARLRQAKATLKKIPEGEVAERLGNGRKHLAKRLKKRLKRLEQDDPGADELHGARKALKAWLGALAHLGETPPPAMTALADRLGDINDLHTLGEWLHAHGFSPELATEPWRALREKLHLLEKSALAEAPGVRVLLG
jgi:CHAD domain-containing protein